MTYILIVWTIVASGGTQTSYYKERDWRPIGVFYTQQACENAAKLMGVAEFRCLPTGGIK